MGYDIQNITLKVATITDIPLLFLALIAMFLMFLY